MFFRNSTAVSQSGQIRSLGSSVIQFPERRFSGGGGDSATPPPPPGDFHFTPGGGDPPNRSRLRVFLVVLVATVSTWLVVSPPGLTPSVALVSQIGETRHFRLAGDAICDLNTDTRVRLTSTAREWHLELKNGEVFCETARNPSRSLVITVDDLVVTDVGTAFSVMKAENGVLITVRDGIVRLHADDLTDTTLVSNERAEVVDHSHIWFPEHSVTTSSLPSDAIARRLSWRYGHLEFKGEALSTVLHEINRYNAKVRLIVNDPHLAQLAVGITIDPRNPVGGFVNRLPIQLNQSVRWQKTSHGGVTIYELQKSN